MKKTIILLFFFGFLPMCHAQEGKFTFGYVWGIISRGGFMAGYNLTDDVGIEAHLGGVPHLLTYGLTAKIRVKDGDNDHFSLIGITRVGIFNRYQKGGSWATGINLGYRYALKAGTNNVSYPLEVGICPLLNRPIILKEQKRAEPDSNPQKATSDSDSRNVEPESDTQKAESDSNLQFEESKWPPVIWFGGFGIQWSGR